MFPKVEIVTKLVQQGGYSVRECADISGWLGTEETNFRTITYSVGYRNIMLRLLSSRFDHAECNLSALTLTGYTKILR